MGYPQWVVIIIHNLGSDPVKVKNVSLSWGKFHVDGDKDKEISKDQIEGKVIGLDEQFQINSCGREGAWSGTEGSFDLVDVNDGDKTIRHFYWDCPWSSSTNTWTISGDNPNNWHIQYEGANLHDGALGTITVKVKKGD